MIPQFVAALIPTGLVLIGIVPLLVLTYSWRQKQRRHARESPLSRDLLRPPGHSLRERIEDLTDQFTVYALMGMVIPLVAYAAHISQSYFGKQPETPMRIGITALSAAAFFVWVSLRLVRVLRERRQCLLGLEGELTTAEELHQLMLDGCRVFHDIPFPYGNIDHVVVSLSGVHTINTKALSKPKEGEGKADVVVDHDRGIVRFPDRQYRIPHDQLETEARWLSTTLSDSVGSTIHVEPMLTLPGWNIANRIGRGGVYVFNPRKPQKFFLHQRILLDPKLLQQVAHQLDQLCRNVKPSFRESKAWQAQR